MIRHSKTKIVATMGPASAREDILTEMIKAGVNVCRLNFSHSNQADHQKTIDLIHTVNQQLSSNVCILADLQGPKIRIGKVQEGGISLFSGDHIELTTIPCIGNEKQVHITYEDFPKDVKPNDIILLDDGKLQMKVLATNESDKVMCEIIHGGLLTSRKGVNLPNTKVSIPSLTDEDKINLAFALENDVEWIALSFVRTADDIQELRTIIQQSGKNSRIVAKIEKPEAIENIDAILNATDAVMVARGDLGVELPPEEVPWMQKMIIKKSRSLGKPVIVATQMLESMMTTPRPTRAEVNDIANSVLDGADAVMLSGETSVGEFPIEVIDTMHRVIKSIEQNSYPYNDHLESNKKSETFLSEIACRTACHISYKTDAKCIVAMTSSGYTAFQIARHRPKSDIYMFTSNKSVLNALSLVWGVKGFLYDKHISTDVTIKDVNEYLIEEGLVTSGDVIINTASVPLQEHGRTNMLKISVI